MIELDFSAARQAEVNADPFAHIVVPHFVPPASLAQVVACLPTLAQGGSFPVQSLRLAGAARTLLAQLEGPALRRLIADKFALDLTGAPTMVTLRGQSRKKDGRIHCDSAVKRVTVLLYLNPRSAAWSSQDGCLRLLRGPADLEDYGAEVPPLDGTLLAFPNSPAAWHGHKTFVGPRYVIQLNYMTNDGAARSELRRHKISAVLKRLTAA